WVTLEALARPGASERSAWRSRASLAAGQISLFMGRYAEAREHLEACIAIAREVADLDRLPIAFTLLAHACIGQQDLTMAHRHAEQAVALARAQGDDGQLYHALNAVAEVHRAEGDLEGA